MFLFLMNPIWFYLAMKGKNSYNLVAKILAIMSKHSQEFILIFMGSSWGVQRWFKGGSKAHCPPFMLPSKNGCKKPSSTWDGFHYFPTQHYPKGVGS
jgi:hypothetical protein